MIRLWTRKTSDNLLKVFRNGHYFELFIFIVSQDQLAPILHRKRICSEFHTRLSRCKVKCHLSSTEWFHWYTRFLQVWAWQGSYISNHSRGVGQTFRHGTQEWRGRKAALSFTGLTYLVMYRSETKCHGKIWKIDVNLYFIYIYIYFGDIKKEFSCSLLSGSRNQTNN